MADISSRQPRHRTSTSQKGSKVLLSDLYFSMYGVSEEWRELSSGIDLQVVQNDQMWERSLKTQVEIMVSGDRTTVIYTAKIIESQLWTNEGREHAKTVGAQQSSKAWLCMVPFLVDASTRRSRCTPLPPSLLFFCPTCFCMLKKIRIPD